MNYLAKYNCQNCPKRSVGEKSNCHMTCPRYIIPQAFQHAEKKKKLNWLKEQTV